MLKLGVRQMQLLPGYITSHSENPLLVSLGKKDNVMDYMDHTKFLYYCQTSRALKIWIFGPLDL